MSHPCIRHGGFDVDSWLDACANGVLLANAACEKSRWKDVYDAGFNLDDMRIRSTYQLGARALKAKTHG